jgi:hypothetical protein
LRRCAAQVDGGKIGEHHDDTIRRWLEGDGGKLARIQEILQA